MFTGCKNISQRTARDFNILKDFCWRRIASVFICQLIGGLHFRSHSKWQSLGGLLQAQLQTWQGLSQRLQILSKPLDSNHFYVQGANRCQELIKPNISSKPCEYCDRIKIYSKCSKVGDALMYSSHTGGYYALLAT